VNNNLKISFKRLLAKERPIVSANAISNFLVTINPYKKDNAHQKTGGDF
jgi:hypothetical protein